MGRAVAGAVPGLRPPLRDRSKFGASRQDDAVGVLTILAVPVADRVLGQSEGGGRRHDPRDPRLVRSKSPTCGRAAGWALLPPNQQSMMGAPPAQPYHPQLTGAAHLPPPR